MTEIAVPVLEPDDSNSQLVRLALAAVLLGNRNVSVEGVRAEVRYRLSDGSVRFLVFGDEDVTR
jgi:hypothetical protein